MEHTKKFDYVGRLKRQRKPRIIEIDTREPHDGLTGILLRGLGYTITIRALPLGDYQWDSRLGRFIVERKTPADLRDLSRLSRQVERLRLSQNEGDAFCILLIDHRTEYDRGDYQPWADNALDNLLLSLSGTVGVAHCLQGQLAHRLDSLYRWSQKANHGFLEVR